MKKLYILIILFIVTFLATQIQAQPGGTTRIPFLGNGFIAAENMPGMFEDFARKAGCNVYELRGSDVYRESFGRGDGFSCRLPELPSGIYLMRISTEQGAVTERLIRSGDPG